jgi:hypothetical protein
MSAEEAVRREVTVISRAPRPLYVNHDRTEPVPGTWCGTRTATPHVGDMDLRA